VADIDDIPFDELAERLYDRLAARFGACALLSVADRANNVGGTGPGTQTGNYTVQTFDASLIFNGGAGITVTLPSASITRGRQILMKTIAAFTVVSASGNVVPLAGGGAGTAILAAVAGRWALLESDGTNWVIMAAN